MYNLVYLLMKPISIYRFFWLPILLKFKWGQIRGLKDAYPDAHFRNKMKRFRKLKIRWKHTKLNYPFVNRKLSLLVWVSPRIIIVIRKKFITLNVIVSYVLCENKICFRMLHKFFIMFKDGIIDGDPSSNARFNQKVFLKKICYEILQK